MSRRPDIQGLRAVAVLVVVADHAGVPGLTGGYVGVDVFFVVSGFLITGLLLREAQQTGTVSLTGFYARRARRILPAATVVLLAVTAYAARALPLTRVPEVVQDVLWSSLFAANVRFSRTGTDYFAQGAAPSPVQHYWSLAVEEQFYLVWPLLVLLVVLAARRRTRANRPARAPAPLPGLLPVLLVVVLVSFGWCVVLTASAPAEAYFSSAARAWELAVGALVALAAPRLTAVPRLLRGALGMAGLGAVAWAVVSFSEVTAFPGWVAALPVLGTAAVLVAGLPGPAAASGQPGQVGQVGQVGPARVLQLRPLRLVGDASFSLYLWHWPVLVLGSERLGHAPDVLQTAGLLALAAALTVASFTLVETPFRAGRVGRLSRGRGALALWPLAVGSVIAGVVWSHGQVDAERGRLVAASRAYERAHPSSDPTGGIRSRVRQALAAADAGAPVPYPLANEHLSRDLWQVVYDCYATWKQPTSRICPVGDPDATRDLVVYGDSHAGMWVPSLDEIGQHRHLRVVPLVKVGCGPFDVLQQRPRFDFADCPAFRTWAEARIRELRPAVLVLSYRALMGVEPADGLTPLELWSRGVASAVARLGRWADRVVVVSDVDTLDFRPGECVSARQARLSACVQVVTAPVAPANRATRLATTGAGASYVEVADLSCQEGRCPAVVGRTVTYRDPWHLSLTWTRELTPTFERRLAAALGCAGPGAVGTDPAVRARPCTLAR